MVSAELFNTSQSVSSIAVHLRTMSLELTNSNQIISGNIDFNTLSVAATINNIQQSISSEMDNLVKASAALTNGTQTISSSIGHVVIVQSSIFNAGQTISSNASHVHNLSASLINTNQIVSATTVHGEVGFNALARKIAIQPDGKILVTGNFTMHRSTTANRIARLNTDGSRDITFDAGSGFNATTRVALMLPDGKLLAGGSFTTFRGSVANNVAIVNIDGTHYTSFYSGISGDFEDNLQGLSIQSTGKIIATGPKTVLRLLSNGNKDTSFTATALNEGGASYVSYLFPDDSAIITGDFSTYSGVTTSKLAKINSEGVIDTSFTSNMGGSFAGTSPNIRSIIKTLDNKLVVVGRFDSFNGVSCKRLARFNLDGTPSIPSLGSGFDGGDAYTVVQQSDGKLLVGGSFTSFQGSTQLRLIRLDYSTFTKDSSFNIGTGFNNSVWDIAIQSDGKIIVVGDFTTYNLETVNRIVRLNTDGSRDTTFG